LTTAEGGAVASTHVDLLKKARRFSRQGLIRDKDEFLIRSEGAWHQEVHEFGLNYRLPDVLCALGVNQLKRLHEFKEIRSNIFKRYQENLQSIPNLNLPTMRKYVDPMWHLYAIHVEPQFRARIFEQLRESGVGVQVNYMPANWHPAFKYSKTKDGEFPISEHFYRTEISLPLHTQLSEKDIEFIVKQVKKTLG
jgi:dTDP-4-amino-4,6-dideoxygalactose transaminase